MVAHRRRRVIRRRTVVHVTVRVVREVGRLRRRRLAPVLRAALVAGARALGRSGRLFEDRYHDVHLASPRQVRAALCYVLNNARRHGERLEARYGGIDPFSSAWYFDGWADEGWRQAVGPPGGAPPVAPATHWLLTTGWRRHRLISPTEVPAAAT